MHGISSRAPFPKKFLSFKMGRALLDVLASRTIILGKGSGFPAGRPVNFADLAACSRSKGEGRELAAQFRFFPCNNAFAKQILKILAKVSKHGKAASFFLLAGLCVAFGRELR